MEERLRVLLELIQSLGRIEVLAGYPNAEVVVRLPREQLVGLASPPGVVLEALPDKPEPPLDMLLTLPEAVQEAHAQGHTAVEYSHLWADVKGVEANPKRPGRPKRFVEGQDVFLRGKVWLITRRALHRRLQERAEGPGPRPKDPGPEARRGAQ